MPESYFYVIPIQRIENQTQGERVKEPIKESSNKQSPIITHEILQSTTKVDQQATAQDQFTNQD